MNKLEEYNKKRNFNKTNEPSGKKIKTTKKKLKFVVQHHLARKDHYDLRLEWNGVLKSWAIPKGPSYNTKDKRLAVQVEDHPLDYRNFEGTIPKGEYGGGTVMIWDKGTWKPSHIPDFNKKAIKFTLNGKRLIGQWSLVPFKEKNWLLIKENDDKKMFENIDEYNTSIKTGRTMEEIEKKIKNKKENTTKILGIEITNPDKIIYPKPKITKMDIVKYYEKVHERMIPLIKNRLISTVRAPEGITKDIFFKKHFETQNTGIGKVELPSESGKKEDYYYFKNAQGLISEVQMNSFEFHIWGSKVKSINKPDLMVFDLDPDDNLSLKKVRDGVRDLKSILDEIGLKSFLKTSGGKGYHIIVPIKKKSWEEFKDIAENIAKLMESKWPNKYTTNIRKKQRKGKIFIDWMRNTYTATSVAPYSLRLKKKLTVSMPIFWDELNTIKPDGITIKKAIKRLSEKDPWEELY